MATTAIASTKVKPFLFFKIFASFLILIFKVPIYFVKRKNITFDFFRIVQVVIDIVVINKKYTFCALVRRHLIFCDTVDIWHFGGAYFSTATANGTAP